MKIRLGDLTWPELEEILKKSNAVIVPIGSIEQHGLHLPLSVDYRCPAYIAELAAKKVTEKHNISVLVAPSVHYGEVATAIKGFPGCIGVSTDTAIRLFEDIARSLIASGFKNIIFLNGHYTNVAPLIIALRKVSRDFPKAGLYATSWLDLGFEVIPKIRRSKWGTHAEELETSASMVIQPENVRSERAVAEFPKFSLSDRWIKPVFFHSRQKYPDKAKGDSGVMGDPSMASRETGEKILAACAEDLVKIIVEVVESERIAET